MYRDEDEDSVIRSLHGFAAKTAKTYGDGRMRYYGLSDEDVRQEVLLACVELNREWKPREWREGDTMAEETNHRTYCSRWGRVRAWGNIKRKYGRNLRHTDSMRLKVSSACAEEDARTDEPQFLKAEEAERRERITNEIVRLLFGDCYGGLSPLNYRKTDTSTYTRVCHVGFYAHVL